MEGKEKQQKFPDLSENEKKLVETVTKGSLEEVKVLLQEKDVKVDCLDESGMTPLQHAAFRGKTEVAELLLTHGADVNSNFHENGYTSLMFAALSGNTDTTRLMLKHGAKKDRTNSVGRNAAQMAAFVGQHQCVAVINNYYDKEDLEYYTTCRGQEKEPKLPPMVLPALLKLLNMANMHPVKISLHLQEHPELMNESYKVCKVLDLICEKAMKSRDTDDIMAMKAHYMATLIRKAKDAQNLDVWIKSLLRGRDSDGHPEFQDQLIRQALKEFPYVESQLLQTMVQQLARTKIGDNPTSLNILNQGINGQKFGFDEEKDCYTCGERNAKTCTSCKSIHYCNRNCQKLHFFTHKKFCKKLAEEHIKAEERKKMEEEKQAAKQQQQQQNGDASNKQNTTDGTESKTSKDASGMQQDTELIYSRVPDESKSKVQENKTSSGEDKLPKDFLEGYPGASELLRGGAASAHPDLPDIDKLLDSPEISKAFSNPDIIKALEIIANDPSKISEYKDDNTLHDFIDKIPDLLGVSPPPEEGPQGGATDMSTFTSMATVFEETKNRKSF